MLDQGSSQMDAESEARLSLGRLLERVRRGAKKQRNEVSTLIGVSNSALSDVENGYVWPTDTMWEELSRLYGLHIDMMASMKRTAANGARVVPTHEVKLAETNRGGKVISLDKYRSRSCQPTTTSNPD